MNIFIHALVWKKEEFHSNSYTNFISEIINIDFWQIWHFHVRVTERVGLKRKFSIIFMQTVGRFNTLTTSYTGILTLAKLKCFMSKDLSTKTQSCTAANKTRRHSEYGIRNIVCKVCLRKSLIKRLIFDDSDEIEVRLPCCWSVLIFWNTYGSYLTQTFNSQTLMITYNDLRSLIIIFNNFQSKKPSSQKI